MNFILSLIAVIAGVNGLHLGRGDCIAMSGIQILIYVQQLDFWKILTVFFSTQYLAKGCFIPSTVVLIF